METLEAIIARIRAAVPGAQVELVPNESPAAQPSLRIAPAHALAVAEWLRADPDLQLDYCSNVTAVDWPEAVLKTKVQKKLVVDGQEQEVEELVETRRPGCLEVVYHLYSMTRKHGPLILRMRTEDRAAPTPLPSLTPVWRSCEFQEREAYDLFGITFTGHPDLRRILMWDGFVDFPMRRDYIEPDDYEYEPTPHDEVLERVKARRAPEVAP